METLKDKSVWDDTGKSCIVPLFGMPHTLDAACTT